MYRTPGSSGGAGFFAFFLVVCGALYLGACPDSTGTPEPQEAQVRPWPTSVRPAVTRRIVTLAS